jgi:regulatory protein
LPKSRQALSNPFTAALRLLARRAYAIAEMRRALTRRSDSAEAVEAAIVRLRQLGYLDDQKFAEQQASALRRNRAFGPRRIVRELKAKGVNYRFIDAAVAQAFEEVGEHQLLEQVLSKKVRNLHLPLTRSRLNSLCCSLLRQGFRGDDIMKAVRARPELRPVSKEVSVLDMEEEAAGSE